ncbi:hypothetical protein BH09BAC5_BH09BAC5_01320 [soil metagenome]
MRIVRETNSDTAKFRLCNQFSSSLSSSDNKSSIAFANMAIALAEKRNDKKGKAEGLNNLGYALYYSGESDSAISIYNIAIHLAREANDSSNVSLAMNRLGFIYREKGETAQSLVYYNQSLASNIGEKNKSEAANSYLNIGVIYNDLGNYTDALRYEEKGLKLFTETGDQSRIANSLARIGNTYLDSKDTVKSIEYYGRSLEMFTKINNLRGIAVCLNNIANIYNYKNDIPKAIEYYERALAIREKIGDRNGVALICNNLGALMVGEKEYEKAIGYFERALDISTSLDYRDQIKSNNFGLSNAYEGLGDDKKALSYYKNYYAINDSLFNENNAKQINELNTKFDTERKLKDIASLTKENELQTRRNIFMGVAILLLLLLVIVVFRNVILSKRANVLLQQQKTEISSQKKIVEEQHRDILDSINYAKRIQGAVLPTKVEIHALFPRSFVFFRPRDIVSGDFWWIGKHGNVKIIAVADCTGHGVPGAFMSLIGNTALNEIVKEKHITDPGEILFSLANNIVSALKQDSKESENSTLPLSMQNVKDGMDISLCAIDEVSGIVKFAGANNPLYYVQQGEMKEIKGDRQPVGVFDGDLKPFTVHTIPMKDLSAIYLFSDGYADQFGGPQGKKMKYSKLKEILFQSVSQTPAEQEKFLAENFDNWKDKLDQVDDVLVAGIKF